ncbi:serine hydrolase domain-containing protein [Bacillus suaedaesalsae]|uniref:Serine hydrolase n=1 Tax=Bacillus suaedaesalsae TaxID=2810349 RepID=A0ABS2DD17_9BACI|nr:serine hydrolase [Bacillus suaedaesalsae]MBM6616354.1 serine hydrolase [Bacillus suaedaesalsae]
MIHHKGKTVYDYYRNRKMQDRLHKVNSITKSVLSILVGIAIDRKEIKSVYDPVYPYFTEINTISEELTIEHLLTMSPGIDWPEFGSWNAQPFPMINSKDWVKFVFNRDRTDAPGQTMIYNSGCSHVLSAIVQKATGEMLQEYAKKHLFDPLQIRDTRWHSDSKGIAIGGFGLCLSTEDMMKIGTLMLQNGVWNGETVVSEGWVKESTSPRLNTYNDIGSYGYHWWILTDETKQTVNPFTYFALGYRGQYIILIPEYDLITTITSDLDRSLLRLKLFKENILSQINHTTTQS